MPQIAFNLTKEDIDGLSTPQIKELRGNKYHRSFLVRLGIAPLWQEIHEPLEIAADNFSSGEFG
jgi:hypothetical protein